MADLLDDLVRRAAAAPRPMVLIDGRTGAGKSELAGALAPRLGAQLVGLDLVYPGWDGLAVAAAEVPRMLTVAEPGWRGGVWDPAGPGTRHPLDPAAPLVVEGCGALTPASAALATLRIWIEVDAEERHRRILARDGERDRPHWTEWAAQEEAHLAADRPRELADLILGPGQAQPSRWSSSSSRP